MKNLTIIALSLVVILSGCVGYTSRTLPCEQKQVDESLAKKARTRCIDTQMAAKIAMRALEHYKYSITSFKCKSDDYARIKANKYVGFFFIHGKYRTDIKITKKDIGHHEYKVSSRRKDVRSLEFNLFPEFNPLKWYQPYHRDEKEEKKILDCIEKKCQ